MDHPDIFYKYTSADTAAIILQSGKLRWSSPSMFNDPAEFQRMPRVKPTIEEACPDFIKLLIKHAFGECEIDFSRLPDSTKRKINFFSCYAKNSGKNKEELFNEFIATDSACNQDKITSQLKARTEQLCESVRVFCVTTEYDNGAMWGHYADSHAGCVLGFRHLPELDTPLLEAKPVSYTDEIPIICGGLDLLLYDNAPELGKKSTEIICYSKKSGWAYEREWRVIKLTQHENGKNYNDYEFNPEELESAILGTNVSANNSKKILDLVNEKYKKCKIYKMVARNGELYRQPYYA